MPQVTVYIRDEDLEKWKSIKRKSLFLHEVLNGKIEPKVFVPEKDFLASYPIETKETTQENVFVPKPPDPEAGYPCCSKAKPCKHWQWNPGVEAWVNSLTGKQREADIL